MAMELIQEKAEKAVDPLLREMGLELVELNIRRQKGETTVQILADRPLGGITLTQCAELNRRIGEMFEKDSVFAESCTVEVSSPGLDRPLRTVKDFTRVTGRKVRFYLSEPVENSLEYSGIIQQADEEGIAIGLESRRIVIPLNKINKAVQII